MVFGPGGIWRELLSRGTGYLGSEVSCESAAERRYRVRDFWISHRWFELFREKFSVEYERLERLLSTEGLLEREQFVGAYYEKERGDGDELVPG